MISELVNTNRLKPEIAPASITYDDAIMRLGDEATV
jgi:hypothetical protein